MKFCFFEVWIYFNVVSTLAIFNVSEKCNSNPLFDKIIQLILDIKNIINFPTMSNLCETILRS